MTISNSPKASTKNCWAAFRSALARPGKRSKRPLRKPRPAAASRLLTARANWGSESKSSARAGNWRLESGATPGAAKGIGEQPRFAKEQGSQSSSEERPEAVVAKALGPRRPLPWRGGPCRRGVYPHLWWYDPQSLWQREDGASVCQSASRGRFAHRQIRLLGRRRSSGRSNGHTQCPQHVPQIG